MHRNWSCEKLFTFHLVLQFYENLQYWKTRSCTERSFISFLAEDLPVTGKLFAKALQFAYCLRLTSNIFLCNFSLDLSLATYLVFLHDSNQLHNVFGQFFGIHRGRHNLTNFTIVINNDNTIWWNFSVNSLDKNAFKCHILKCLQLKVFWTENIS